MDGDDLLGIGVNPRYAADVPMSGADRRRATSMSAHGATRPTARRRRHTIAHVTATGTR